MDWINSFYAMIKKTVDFWGLMTSMEIQRGRLYNRRWAWDGEIMDMDEHELRKDYVRKTLFRVRGGKMKVGSQ